MKFMGKKWILVGLAFLVLASGVSAIIEFPPCKIIDKPADLEAYCLDSHTLIINDDVKSIEVLEMPPDSYVDTNTFVHMQFAKAENLRKSLGVEGFPILLYSDMMGDYKLKINGSYVIWASNKYEPSPSLASYFVFIYFVLGFILFAIGCLLFILKKNRKLAVALIFLSISWIILVMLSLTLAY